MKKIILAVITLLCLSTPLYAQEVITSPCRIIDIPCYIASDETVLREEPNKDSRIVLQASPARKGSKIYFYLRQIVLYGEKFWGYFEAVEPIVDLMTGKTSEGGWAPLSTAFTEVVWAQQLLGKADEGVTFFLFKPNTPMLIVNSKLVTGAFPLKEYHIMKQGK